MKLQWQRGESLTEKQFKQIFSGKRKGYENVMICFTCGVDHTTLKEALECCSSID